MGSKAPAGAEALRHGSNFIKVGEKVICLRMVFLGFVLVCWTLLVKEKGKTSWWCAPGITFTSISCVLYYAGILNLMDAAVWGICLSAVLIPIHLFRQGKRFADLYSKDLIPVLIISGAGLIYLSYYCYGGHYADGDTMTHWGIIVREMIETGRMPNFTTTEVSYQSYPTGTAGWIFFCCRIAGYSDSKSMFAQGLLTLSLLLSFFSVAEKSGKWGLGLMTLLCLWLIHFNVSLDDLKVDQILPLLSLSGMAILFSTQKDPERGIQLTAPILCLLVITKNSGLIYWIFVLLYLGKLLCLDHSKNAIRQAVLWSVLAPGATWLLWERHIAMVFSNAASSRHSMSLTAMLHIYETKSSQDIQTIVDNYWIKWFRNEWNNTHEWIFFGLCVLAFITAIVLTFRQKDTWKTYTIDLVFCVLGYFVYKIALLGMYLFNMPDSDALFIGAYDRYVNSITVMLAVLGVFALLALPSKGVRIASTAHWVIRGLCLAMVLAFMVAKPESLFALNRPDYQQDGVYRKLYRLQHHYHLDERDGHYLVYTHVPYSQFFVNYCFRSPDCLSVTGEEFEQICIQDPGRYEALMVLDHDEVIDSLLEKGGYSTVDEFIPLTAEQNLAIVARE